jgi:hypothetical protein
MEAIPADDMFDGRVAEDVVVAVDDAAAANGGAG